MQISDKVLRMRQDLGEVFEAGYAKGVDESGGAIYYATSLRSTFAMAVIPSGYEMTVKTRKAPSDMYQAFAYVTGIKSVKLLAEEQGAAVSMAQTFRECSSLEVVDLTGYSRKIQRAEYLFFNSNKLRSVLGALDLSECTENSWLDYAFFASVLQDVEFVPGTIKVNIRLNSSFLTDTSINSIINGLANVKSIGIGRVLTLNGVGGKLTDAQRLSATMKGWTIVTG